MRAVSAILLLSSAVVAAARPPVDEGARVRILVVDPAGAPITTARVYALDAHEFGSVDDVTGAWEATVLYRPDGGEIHPEPGMTLRFKAFAPGYAPAPVDALIRGRKVKKNTATAVLVPRPVVPLLPAPPASKVDDPAVADPHDLAGLARAALDAGRDGQAVELARQATAASAQVLDGAALQARVAALDEIVMIGSWRQWIAAERAFFAAPSREADVVLVRMRDQTFEGAKRALLTVPAGTAAATLARELCEEASRRIDRCDP